MATEEKTTKVVNSKKELVRFSYAHVFEPRAIDENSAPKYSCSILIPKDGSDDFLQAIDEAIKVAVEEGIKNGHFAAKDTKSPKFKWPLKDGDDEKDDDEAYQGMYFVNANATKKPGVKGTEKDEFDNLISLTSEEEFYSGCWGRASITFFAYGKKTPSKGIGCALNHVQKIKDGDRLSGGASAEADFEDDDLD